MTTSMEFLRVLPSTKDQVQHFASKLRSELLGGDVDPLELVKLKKTIEAVFAEIKTDLDQLALSAAEKYGGKSFETMGLKITVGENGTAYDYKNCNDPLYNDLSEMIAKLTEQRKERETFLKTIKAPLTVVDEETGDMAVINPPIKTSTTGLKVSLV